MNEVMVDVQGLHVAYGDFVAVREVSFSVRRGELFALLGTNGAGKTTTMETLEGHRRPTRGTVRVVSKDPFRERASVHGQCGIMLQSGGFAGDLTVRETARLWSRIVTSRSTVDEGLERLGLAHRAGVRVKQLSGGERRRLDLVLATLGRPEVLFLDEPTTGLDPESRQATWELVSELLAEGTTVLLTTHYLEEAERLAHRLAIMHEGRIAVAGSLADVLARYRARIDFRVVGDAGAAPVPGLPVLSGTIEPQRAAEQAVRVVTDDLQGDLERVLAWARTHGLRLHGLSARHASLDEVFRDVVDSGRPQEVAA
ncbi:ABC transporter ATP-binding protein [Saccharomonospora piscinae]|uniref:ABC transporter ATP-binding protein n=1 Tax=Saccharomonospora piscinae TaxID=687388 RepID=UPI000463D5B7|nr:ABC transporter ATP-binding protein [Saccharomonospora piscinae]